jgi:hypothetical protein
LMNHQWLMPSGSGTGPNVRFEADGTVKALRDIVKSEPVRVDYGFDYWADKLLNVDFGNLSHSAQKGYEKYLMALLPNANITLCARPQMWHDNFWQKNQVVVFR